VPQEQIVINNGFETTEYEDLLDNNDGMTISSNANGRNETEEDIHSACNSPILMASTLTFFHQPRRRARLDGLLTLYYYAGCPSHWMIHHKQMHQADAVIATKWVTIKKSKQAIYHLNHCKAINVCIVYDILVSGNTMNDTKAMVFVADKLSMDQQHLLC
jgi:hypothetical protein